MHASIQDGWELCYLQQQPHFEQHQLRVSNIAENVACTQPPPPPPPIP